MRRALRSSSAAESDDSLRGQVPRSARFVLRSQRRPAFRERYRGSPTVRSLHTGPGGRSEREALHYRLRRQGGNLAGNRSFVEARVRSSNLPSGAGRDFELPYHKLLSIYY
jgi:hypothetical protein